MGNNVIDLYVGKDMTTHMSLLKNGISVLTVDAVWRKVNQMADVLPKNHLSLACLYVSAKDEPYPIRKRYAEIMEMLLKLDKDMREGEQE